jgi:hypothetical protein
MTTPERDPGRAGNGVAPAAGDQGGGAGGSGSRPPRSAGTRHLLLVALVALLGFAAGSWTRTRATVAAPDEPSLGSEEVPGCAFALPPGHPPIGNWPGLPPGHPPVWDVPRLPAGHPPIRSLPPPALLVPQAQPFDT